MGRPSLRLRLSSSFPRNLSIPLSRSRPFKINLKTTQKIDGFLLFSNEFKEVKAKGAKFDGGECPESSVQKEEMM